MNHHILKCLKEFYPDVVSGIKNFEVRKNDRDFKVDDTIELWEVDPEGYSTGKTGPTLRITYILQGTRWGIMEGYCVLGLKTIKNKS